jgi:hypothetical protein
MKDRWRTNLNKVASIKLIRLPPCRLFEALSHWSAATLGFTTLQVACVAEHQLLAGPQFRYSFLHLQRIPRYSN